VTNSRARPARDNVNPLAVAAPFAGSHPVSTAAFRRGAPTESLRHDAPESPRLPRFFHRGFCFRRRPTRRPARRAASPRPRGFRRVARHLHTDALARRPLARLLLHAAGRRRRSHRARSLHRHRPPRARRHAPAAQPLRQRRIHQPRGPAHDQKHPRRFHVRQSLARRLHASDQGRNHAGSEGQEEARGRPEKRSRNRQPRHRRDHPRAHGEEFPNPVPRRRLARLLERAEIRTRQSDRRKETGRLRRAQTRSARRPCRDRLLRRQPFRR
jgi:hypothetical protein